MSNNNNDNNPDPTMVPCDNCGTMVPALNLTMHKLHCTSNVVTGAAASAAAVVDENTNNNQNDDDDWAVVDHNNNNNNNANHSEEEEDVIDLSNSQTTPTQALLAATRKRQDDDEPSSPPPRRKQRQGRLKREDDDSDDDNNDNDSNDNAMETEGDNDQKQQPQQEVVVDLLDSDDEDEDDEWTCPRCTLLNDKAVDTCEACNGPNPNVTSAFAAAASSRNHNHNNTHDEDGVRPPDPVRRERLIGGDSPPFLGYAAASHNHHHSNNNAISPLRTVGGSALMGGVLGAAGAYMRGEAMSRGAIEGSVAGAVTGMFINEVVRSPDPPRPSSSSSNAAAAAGYAYRHNGNDDNHHDSTLSQARSAGANGLPPYPVMGDGSRERRSSRQPRASFRVAQVESPEGYTTTVVSSGRNGSTRIVRRSQHQDHSDPLLSLMMHSLMSAEGGLQNRRRSTAGGGVDRMSYERLLEAFGDGTENMGLTEGVIRCLPTAKVRAKQNSDKVDLPPDACQCSVCLEHFEAGDIRKTLPCLHGFHEKCIDKWLKTNGACPVCKFRADQNSNFTDSS